MYQIQFTSQSYLLSDSIQSYLSDILSNYENTLEWISNKRELVSNYSKAVVRCLLYSLSLIHSHHTHLTSLKFSSSSSSPLIDAQRFTPRTHILRQVLRVPSQRPNYSLWLSANAFLVLQLPHRKPNGCP
ncbi:hypothetical protein SLA2020_299170 [Shorea laevis]